MSTYDKLVGATSEGLLPPAVLEHIEPSVSPESTTFWVSITGDDSADGSEVAPFRTIDKAMSMVPDLVRADHVYTITLGVGEWDEMITPEHRIVYGQLIIQGSTPDPRAHRVTGVRADTILGHITVRNLHGTSIFGSVFRFYRCAPLVEVENVVADSEAGGTDSREGIIGLLADTGSHVRVSDSEFTGRRYGMRCNYLSRIFSLDNRGERNQFGLGARWGGILSTHGTQPEGETPLTTDSGGIIGFEHGGKVGVPNELGLLDQKGHGDGSPTVKEYFITSAVAGINSDITNGQKIRMRFAAPADGYMVAKVAYGAQTGSTGAQSIEKHFMGTVRRASMSPLSGVRITSQSMGDDNVTLTHAGVDGVFYIDIVPLVALAGRWGIKIEVVFFRALTAPALESITLLPA